MRNYPKISYDLVGKRAPRHDAWSKVKGEQLYSDDWEMPNTLVCKVLRSKYPAAVLKGVDTSKAEKLPGVNAVLTAKDVPNNIDISKFGQMRDVGGGFEGLYKVLSDGKIRSKAEAIALVAAETEEIAAEALKLIEVDYDVQEGIFDPREALKPGAYLVSGENDSNKIMETKVEKGDLEGAWKDCDVIIENHYYTSPHDHAYMETESGMAWVDDYGVVMLRVGTQVLEHYRTIARILGLPHTKVRNMSVPMGGGFGGKEDITVEAYLALLAYKTRRPVKMTWTREESLECHSKRHPEYLHYKTGATKDGKVICQEAHIVMDGGAYTLLTPWVQMYSTVNGSGPYDIPNQLTHSLSAFTNNTSSSANRGFGAPQVNFAHERQMDELARALKMDPYEIRLKNVLHNGDETSTGFVLEGHIALTEMIEKVRDKLEATPKRERLPDGRKVGRGIAVGQTSYGRLCFLHDSSRVAVRIELDGSVTLRAGVPDVGGGQASVLAQICAEELGLPMEDVHTYVMDTHLTPLAGTTTATRQLYMSGNACLVATRFVKDILARKAARLMDCNPEELSFRNRQIVFTNDPQKSIPFVTAVAHVSNDGELLYHEGQFNAPFTEVPDLTDIKGRIHPDTTFTAYGVEVAVDEETGEYETLRIVACIDCGKAINRNSVEGQLEGGASYNLGWLREDLRWEKGVTRGNSFSTYLIPTSLDVPDVETIVIESGGGLGPYGAKGIGEPTGNAICPASINAICDATGISLFTTLAKPQDVLKAIMAK